MKGTALIFRPGHSAPTVAPMTTEPPLGWLQNHVDGYIQVVPGFDHIEHCGQIHRCVAFCNEEGKLKGMGLNRVATEAWEQALPTGLRNPKGELLDLLVGPIVVLYGDEEFMEAL